jgi:Family of unknown function (DUF6582)
MEEASSSFREISMPTALDKVLALHASAETLAVDEAEQRRQADEDTRQAAELAAAAASGLHEACVLLTSEDLNQCPPAVLEALGMVYASSVALDGLALSGGQDDWVEATALDVTALALAGSSDSDSSKPYGDVPYADPGYQKDGKKRYPIDKSHIRAALAYFSKSSNRSGYTSEQVKSIWGRIKAAARKFGIELSPDTGKVAACQAVLELAAAGSKFPERLIKNHPKFHGAHDHDHMHLNDNRHGPMVAGLAAGNNMVTAFNHPRMTGVHTHPHVHADDATHGPMRAEPDDGNWS